MVEVYSIMVSSLIGMFGVVVGAIVSNYFNQKIARQSARKDIVFKKKVEYFEKILESIELNTRLYKNSIRLIEKNGGKKKISNILKNLKKNRMNFQIMNSPLYLDIRLISYKIEQFVNKEKEIFRYFEGMLSENIFKEEAIRALNNLFDSLRIMGREIVFILRKELVED